MIWREWWAVKILENDWCADHTCIELRQRVVRNHTKVHTLARTDTLSESVLKDIFYKCNMINSKRKSDGKICWGFWIDYNVDLQSQVFFIRLMRYLENRKSAISPHSGIFSEKFISMLQNSLTFLFCNERH